eukprot:NODE_998_length_1052_cov_148.751745_g824_i0.p6 GENE.NODE_998_length_1052_cov_148.751745_g824_i0~~NODE_998_length_1052_cov_148.751745_g824_i0.p6  ORF type:complete len:50 (+),score=11.84 NODE_998_length_1052_cov_148.751745_g824_i0:742-891(+)
MKAMEERAAVPLNKEALPAAAGTPTARGTSPAVKLEQPGPTVKEKDSCC